MTFQAVDNTATNITFMNTEGHALAVDGVGNVYVAGTAIDASSGDHNAYTVKISADGTAIVWGIAFDGPNNVSTGDGIAVNDPNNDGNGQAVMTGTFTNTDASMGTVGDHMLAVRWTADGSNADYANFFTFGDTDSGSHGKAVALNTHSTASTPVPWLTSRATSFSMEANKPSRSSSTMALTQAPAKAIGPLR